MREKILNIIGFSLVGLCFVIAVVRITMIRMERAGENEDGDRVTIRLSHWQLESGVRDAFDAAIQDYMELHPNVNIIQIPIPERIYPNWLITQLVGGTAPDLIQIGIGINDERVARFFEPLSEIATAPNSYNEGTDLEGLPLRETFFDGMQGGYNATLLDYYGVPLSGYTIRVYYNLDLLREITGSEVLPATYDEFIALCERIQEFARETGRTLVPIAGSKYNAPYLMNQLLQSQTQRLTQELIPLGSTGSGGASIGLAYFEGEWSLDSPQVQNGLQLMREVGQHMQPGFMTLGRDDAMFYFTQERAVITTTGSWDATSIASQAPFEVAVGYMPLPSPQTPVFGENVRGLVSEAGVNAGLSLGLTRESENKDVAIDFLRYLASREVNEKFSAVSRWIPSVVGAEPHPQSIPFQMLTEGYLSGFHIITGASGNPDVSRIYNNNFNLLVGPNGSPEAFTDALREDYGPSLASDLERSLRTLSANSQRTSSIIGTYAWLAQKGDEAAEAKLNLTVEAMLSLDRNFYQSGLTARKAREVIANKP